MKTKVFASLILLGVLAGCATPTVPIEKPPVAMRHTARGPAIQRQIIVPARTFAFNEEKKRTEITNVPCSITGPWFSARFTTPANLQLPVYGANSSTLSIVCDYEGRKVTKLAPIVNMTNERIVNSGAGGGLIGVVATGMIAGARGNKATDEYAYHNIDIELNKRN